MYACKEHARRVQQLMHVLLQQGTVISYLPLDPNRRRRRSRFVG